jgi:hypothetical protein
LGALGLACALVAIAGQASAEESGILESRHTRGMSAQNFAVEVRVALYQQQVDSDPALTSHPYANTFGGGFKYEVGLEFDWQAFRIPDVGTIGPAIAVSYTNASGLAPISRTTTSSAESTTLEILPTYAVAVFRLDVLWRQLHIPIVPYGKAGIGLAFWRASNTVGTSVSSTGVVGEGHTWGTQLAGGLAFNLGVLDPNSVRQLDEATGINNTYLFAEYMAEDLDGLGQKNSLRVGTDTAVFGLAFEF